MKKKILFSAYTLDIGGIETALINLLNELIKKYEITLVLEKRQGIFFNELNSKIKIVEYNPNQNKNVLIRKSINLIKRIKFILNYKNKFDFAASFATYSKMGSFCARTASKNNALWIHTDYLALYNNDRNKMINFFKFIKYNKFKNIICISNKARENFIKVLNTENNIYVINNLIDYKSIMEKSKELIDLKKDIQNTTFLNVARHEEESKKITRLILAAEKLKKDNEKFKIILIGDGKDNDLYENMVKQKGLTESIIFLGYKENPYPYFKISDCLILTSEFEGYPVVFNETKILNIPIITTNVSDSEIDIDGKFGIVTKKNVDSIYEAMKTIINQGFCIKETFDVQNYNNEIISKLKILIDGGSNAQD